MLMKGSDLLQQTFQNFTLSLVSGRSVVIVFPVYWTEETNRVKFSSSRGLFPALPRELLYHTARRLCGWAPSTRTVSRTCQGCGSGHCSGPAQNSNCGWCLVLGRFKARENGNWKPKENRGFGSSMSPPAAPYPLSQHPCLNQFPCHLSIQHPRLRLHFHRSKERGGNVQTRWNPQSQCFYCRFHTFGQIDISFQGKSPCQMPRSGNLHFSSNECLLWLAGPAPPAHTRGHQPPCLLSLLSIQY